MDLKKKRKSYKIWLKNKIEGEKVTKFGLKKENWIRKYLEKDRIFEKKRKEN